MQGFVVGLRLCSVIRWAHRMCLKVEQVFRLAFLIDRLLAMLCY